MKKARDVCFMVCVSFLSTILSHPASAVDASLGENCGTSPGGLDPNPPDWWRVPNCSNWEFQIPCAQGTQGYFYDLGGMGNWSAICCPSNKHGVVYFDYDENGNLLTWGIVCEDGAP